MANIPEIIKEQVVFLRNNDVFSTTVRGVTTDTYNEALVSAGSATISVSAIKNIRSVTVDATPLSFGSEYTVAYGITNAVITFAANQTGALVVTYDYGPDKIFDNFPRNDLTINSYPRIAVDILNGTYDAFGIGGDSFISDFALTIVVYATKKDDINDYVETIKNLYRNNAKSFYYLPFIKVTGVGPTLDSENKKQEIMQKNVDILGMFSVEQSA